MERTQTSRRKGVGIVGVLLAAGRGTRFAASCGSNTPKLSMPAPPSQCASEDRDSVGLRTLRRMLEAHAGGPDETPTFSEILIISSAEVLQLWARDRGDDERQVTVRTLLNPRARDGLASSIRLAVASTPLAAGWVFLPADLPTIAAPTIRRVAETLKQSASDSYSIVRPFVQEQPAHPVGINRSHFTRLLGLTGDFGAAPLIAQYDQEVLQLRTDDLGSVDDIDTLDDWRRLSGLANPATPSAALKGQREALLMRAQRRENTSVPETPSDS